MTARSVPITHGASSRLPVNTVQERFLLGGFFLLMGILISMAAFGVGPMSDSQMHAPRWVVGVAGVLFASSSVVLVAPAHRIARVAAGVIVVGLSAICAWVALFGEAQYFGGGTSLFSRSTEVFIARVVFGMVAILGTAISANALRRALSGHA